MELKKKLFTNCACPQGRMGRAMLRFMNLCHAPLTNWGLKLIDIQDGWTMLDIGCGGGCKESYIDIEKCTDQIEVGDVLLLCSDGLTDMVDNETIKGQLVSMERLLEMREQGKNT